MTSALSGQRSNRLSYRPALLPTPHLTPQAATPPNEGCGRDQSSASVTSRPPSTVADRLYKNANNVASAVVMTILSTDNTAV